MEKENYYEKKSKSLARGKTRSDNKEMDTRADKKENITEVIKNVMSDAGIAVVGGGLASSVLGRLSLPLGLLITGYGHHKKNNALRTLGIGIMASASMADRKSQNPNATMMENMGERVKAFGEELKNKLCLDLLQKKVSAKKETKQSDNLKGTDTMLTPILSAFDTPNNKTQSPPANFFEKTKTENSNPECLAAIEKLKQTELHNNFNYDLKDFTSIADKLF